MPTAQVGTVLHNIPAIHGAVLLDEWPSESSPTATHFTVYAWQHGPADFSQSHL